jgi:Ca-activated chloride channel family protein
LLPLPCSADNRQARKLIRQGNSQYRNNKHHDAQISYFKAVNADSTDARAQYNLATSMFPEPWKMVKKEQVDTMTQTLMKAAELEKNPFRKAQAYHNTGVLYQNAKEFKMAIEAYKEALRTNPNDDETRYNLVLCQRQLKNEDQNGGDGGQDNQQEDKQKQDEQKQQQQQQNEQQQDQKEQQEPPMSKENAEQLLNAAMQQEKKTQERMQQKQQQGQRRKLEKNW